MQTVMIADHISMSYICPKCGFKFTSLGSVSGNCELSDKILQRAKNTSKECLSCRKTLLKLTNIVCKVKPIVNQNYYEIKWMCEECGTKWHSLHDDIAPGTLNFQAKLNGIRSMTVCINENCKSSNVKTVSLMYNRKT